MPALPIAAAVALLPGLLLLPVWRLGGLGAGEDDILYYWPARAYFRECVQAGVWPWINPWTGFGRPFMADPQNAVFYPPTWLFAAAPVEAAYPTLLWGHFSLALWGMYRCLRAENLDRRAALFGGIAFAFCGWMLAHRVHFAMHAAAAWTPWVFWRVERYARAGGGLRLVALAVPAALQAFAGHVQVTALTALGTLVFVVARGRRAVDLEPGPRTDATPRRAWAAPARPLTRWTLGWAAAAGLFAVQLLPTLAYVQVCTRGERGYWDFTENSWYPAAALTWVMPMLLGQRTASALFDQPWWGPSHQVEQFAYPGIVCLVLAAVALRGLRGGPGVGLQPAGAAPRAAGGVGATAGWGALLGFALLLALGRYGPLAPLLYWLPGSNLFRVPARALLLANLAVAALAAITLHALAAALTPQRARLRAKLQDWTRGPAVRAAGLIAACCAAALAAVPFLPPEARTAALTSLRPWGPAVIVPLLVAAAGLSALGIVARRWERPKWLWLLAVVLAVDLGIVGWSIDVPRGVSSGAALRDRGQAAAWRAAVEGTDGRLWVVTDTAGVYRDALRKGAANSNVLLRIPGVTDYGPLQPRVLQPLFQFAPWGVTPAAGRLLTESAWMRACNVGWVLVCDAGWPAPAEGELVRTTPAGWRLYRVPMAGGFACFEDASVAGAVHVRAETPYRWITRVDSYAPGVLRDRVRVILSQVAIPGWQAWADGRPVRVGASREGLLAVEVPFGGPVEIVWAYFPPWLVPGAWITAATTIGLVTVGVGTARRRKQAATDGAASGRGPADDGGATSAAVRPETQRGPVLDGDRAADVQPQADAPPVV